jgi:DNA-binding response OmpR family regulator
MDFRNQKPKILYIEDDLTLSSLFTLRLQADGFEVMTMNDADSALQAAKDFKPDLILTDLMMPNLSGFDIIDILHNTMETSLSKIVVISALGDPADIEKAKQLGADEYIVKSQVVLDDIVARLRAVLGMPENSQNPAS